MTNIPNTQRAKEIVDEAFNHAVENPKENSILKELITQALNEVWKAGFNTGLKETPTLPHNKVS